MTITYTLKITALNKINEYVDENNITYNNVITKVHYQYIGVDDDNISAIFNSSVTLSKPTSTDYKNFDELTENDIITWVQSLISDNELSIIKTCIANNIDDKKSITSLPWN